MSLTKKLTRYLFLFTTASISLLSIVSLLAQVEAYYHSGRNLETVHPGFQTQKYDLASISWISDLTENSNEYVKNQISKEYRLSWNWLNSCLNNDDWRGMTDHFTSELGSKLRLQNTHSKKQIVLEHRLTLKHLSRDYTIAVLNDKIKILEYFDTAEKGRQHLIQTYDLDVFMILEDGRWKIFNWDNKLDKHELNSSKNPDCNLTRNLEFVAESRGINYYPQASPWTSFWPNFDGNVIDHDFKLIADLGLNTVRIFLTFEDFGRNTIQEESISKFDQLLEIAKKHNLNIIPTLFDFPIGFDISKVPSYYRQLTFLCERYKDNEVIIAWNLKNEADLDFKIHGKTKVLAWAKLMIEVYKSIDSIHPITIGWADMRNADFLVNEVDYISIHHYGDLDDLKHFFQDRSNKEKLVVVEEFGKPSNTGILNLFFHNETKQSSNLEKSITFFEEQNIPWLIWTLYDFSIAPSAVFGHNPLLKSNQKGFGILDKSGRRKPISDFINSLQVII